MRVNEARTNKIAAINVTTKANYANKQAFLAIPYISKGTSRVFSIAQKLHDFGTYINKNFNPIVIMKNIKKTKAAILNLKVEVRSLDLQKEILSKKLQLKKLELMENHAKLSKSFFKPLTNEEINELFRTPPFTNEQINEIFRNGLKGKK